MDGVTIFLIIWVLAGAYVIITLYTKGKKSLSIFPNIDTVHIIYRDRTASGYSTQSKKTKRSGAHKLLDIVVTENELWTKSMTLFAFIAERGDMLHRIQLNNITRIDVQGRKISIDFKTDIGETKQVVVIPNRPEDFLKAIKQ